MGNPATWAEYAVASRAALVIKNDLTTMNALRSAVQAACVANGQPIPPSSRLDLLVATALVQALGGELDPPR